MVVVVKARVIPVTVVATVALLQAGAGVVVLEVIPVMVELAMLILELVVAVLVVLYIVLHTVALPVAEPALGDKVVLALHQAIVVEKVALVEKAGR